MKFSQFLDRRKNTFERSLDLILKNMKSNYSIVELGTSRSFVSGGFKGCMIPDRKYWQPSNPSTWDWGAGIFTKVFSENLTGYDYKLYTIDPSEDANKIVKTMCEKNENVVIIKDYSSNFLKNIDFKIDFLYMDHMESGEESCLKHLEDCKILIEKDLMSPNGIILIDDVGDNITNTKGKYSIPYLLQNGYSKIMHEYQVLLVRT